MPIINLKIEGKRAIGDGTKIVCMNSDYIVRVECEDCEAFVGSPFKYVVIKSGADYREAPLTTVTEGGQTFEQAILPPIHTMPTVELGVCSRNTDDPQATPVFTSKPAVFDCAKSVLCGAIVLKTDPKLTALEVTENGKYRATEHNADGFYEVDVSVPSAITETRTVDLSMSQGDQIINPSKSDVVMSKVVVTKPSSLIPENLVKGVEIGGVVGTHEKILTETTIYMDGEYTPPTGADGFSKVTVSVGMSNHSRTMHVGETFNHDYTASAYISVDTPGIVKWEDNGDVLIFTALALGSCVVTVDDKDSNGNTIKRDYFSIEVVLQEDRTLPVCVQTVAEMLAYCESGPHGGIVKYVGETGDGFIKDALYIIEEVS